MGVNTWLTPASSSSAASSGGMMPPTTTGSVVQPLGAQPRQDLRDLGAVRPREDRQADHVHAFLQRGGGDARRRQADAIVDHLEPAVAGAQRDLLGAVGMAVEPGLADQHLGAPAQPLGQAVDAGPHP